MWTQLSANVDAHHGGKDRTEVKETNVKAGVTERLITVRVAVRARGGVEKRESAGTATIVANA